MCLEGAVAVGISPADTQHWQMGAAIKHGRQLVESIAEQSAVHKRKKCVSVIVDLVVIFASFIPSGVELVLP